MNQQHVLTDQIATRYADGIDRVWQAWEPELLASERHFRSHVTPGPRVGGEELAADLRRSQYRAHTAGEFAAGLVPPPSASDAHAFLVASLGACRDTLGVLAVRAELDELEADIAEIGLHAVETTRDAFRGARSSTALVHAWVADDQVDVAWMQPDQHLPGTPAPWLATVLWTLVAACAVLFAVLLYEVFRLSPMA